MGTSPLRVVVYRQSIPLTSFLLTEGASVVFGRGTEADIQLPDESVSRAHLRLSHEGGEVWAADLGSTNGTLSGGAPLSRTPRRISPDLLDLSIFDFRIAFRRAQANRRLHTSHARLQKLLGDRDIAVRFCAGAGAHGSVWVGWQESLRRHVAIKLIETEEHLPRFQREAILYSKINDVYVVRCFDFIREGPYAFMLLEYVQGVSLAERMRGGPLDLPSALTAAEGIARALMALEAHALVHRDVKPANVLLDMKGRAKLCDMGIGKDLSEGSGVTSTGSALGSLRYMAPEQMRDASAVGHKADLYGLGATLYHMLAGEPPPLANPGLCQPCPIDDLADTPQRLERNPLALDEVRADCPPELARLVEELLRDNPQDRLPTASAVLENLDRVVRSRRAVAE